VSGYTSRHEKRDARRHPFLLREMMLENKRLTQRSSFDIM